MNDKQQLAAMGAEMAEQPMCMEKRIEELEAQVRVMDGLLREALESVKECANRRLFADERGELILLVRRINASLAGKLPAPVVPEGWQLVPVKLTERMDLALESYLHSGRSMRASMWKYVLAAAPKPEAK